MIINGSTPSFLQPLADTAPPQTPAESPAVIHGDVVTLSPEAQQELAFEPDGERASRIQTHFLEHPPSTHDASTILQGAEKAAASPHAPGQTLAHIDAKHVEDPTLRTLLGDGNVTSGQDGYHVGQLNLRREDNEWHVSLRTPDENESLFGLERLPDGQPKVESGD